MSIGGIELQVDQEHTLLAQAVEECCLTGAIWLDLQYCSDDATKQTVVL
jgi:hypothetical protein